VQVLPPRRSRAQPPLTPADRERDGPTLSPLLKRLEAAGLVTRTRDRHDERQLRIDLTQKGRALREDALRVPPSVVAKLGMSLGELEELHKALTRLNEAARRSGVKPLPAPPEGSV
jgi:DNA-binding MarR family transcriptional regulator